MTPRFIPILILAAAQSVAVAQTTQPAKVPYHVMVIGTVTMLATPWDLEGNFGRLEAYVRDGAKRGARVLITPECALQGDVQDYDPDTTKEKMLAVAQTVPNGPYLVRTSKLCRELGIYLVLGFLEKEGADLYDSCALFDPHGAIIARYRKVNPRYDSFITPGRELPVFDTPFGRIGFLICSDKVALDNYETLGVRGVRIIFIPNDADSPPDLVNVLRQRARDYYCAIVRANTRNADIVDWHGNVLMENEKMECVSIGFLNLADVPSEAERRNFLERRPELYGPLFDRSLAGKMYDENGRPTPLEEKDRVEFREKLRTAPQAP